MNILNQPQNRRESGDFVLAGLPDQAQIEVEGFLASQSRAYFATLGTPPINVSRPPSTVQTAPVTKEALG
jgi:hypothetical protein